MTEEFDDRPSKSQRKRDMEALRVLAEKLSQISADHLARVEDEQIRESVTAATRITKGNARKRQIQYVAKLLSRIDTQPIQQIVDELDASSAAHVQKFHQLESWRERLINGDDAAFAEIVEQYPQCDRQHLRTLIRQAMQEHEQGEQHVQFRKLFQFLKKLEEA